jgi:site-specific DNA-methyltransferase (adenine-specific)
MMREWVSGDGRIRLINGDCLEYMRGLPDKCFELAIVDPPYGVDIGNGLGIGKGKQHGFKRDREWEYKAPTQEYFDQLFRVSKVQIIWGANHYHLPISKGWIFWDKCVPSGVTFSDGELAWTNLDQALRKITIPHSGFTATENKIHPTQKPVRLYLQLLHNYAKEGDRILDTHGGSMSSVVACHEKGFAITCCELDADYYDAGLARVQKAMQQQTLDLGV